MLWKETSSECRYSQVVVSCGLALTVFIGGLAAEHPHNETSPTVDVVISSVPYSASGVVIEDSWEATIDGLAVTLVRRRIAKSAVDYFLVTAHTPESNVLSLPISHIHTARDSVEAIFAEQLTRRLRLGQNRERKQSE